MVTTASVQLIAVNLQVIYLIIFGDITLWCLRNFQALFIIGDIRLYGTLSTTQSEAVVIDFSFFINPVSLSITCEAYWQNAGLQV